MDIGSSGGDSMGSRQEPRGDWEFKTLAHARGGDDFPSFIEVIPRAGFPLRDDGSILESISLIWPLASPHGGNQQSSLLPAVVVGSGAALEVLMKRISISGNGTPRGDAIAIANRHLMWFVLGALDGVPSFMAAVAETADFWRTRIAAKVFVRSGEKTDMRTPGTPAGKSRPQSGQNLLLIPRYVP
jgi:hypothetical protein